VFPRESDDDRDVYSFSKLLSDYDFDEHGCGGCDHDRDRTLPPPPLLRHDHDCSHHDVNDVCDRDEYYDCGKLP